MEVNEGPSSDRSPSVRRPNPQTGISVPARQRSRVANGSALLPGVDNRSTWVRRAKEIISSHISDLGGDDNISFAERSLVRRAAVLTTEIELLESRFATAGQAEAYDLEIYQRCANTLRRLLESIGLQRRAKEVPSLSEYLRSLPKHEPQVEARADEVAP